MGGLFSHVATVSECLFVVLVHFNPQGFQRRDELFVATAAHLLSFPHVRLVTLELVKDNKGAAELTTGPLMHALTRRARWVSREVFHTGDVLWAKENLINKGVAAARKLGAEYIAWVDGDVAFKSNTWAVDTVAALRGGIDILQPWDRAELLGPDGKVLRTVASFAAQKASGKDYALRSNDDAEYWHPGFAWAARAAVFERVGGLLEATLGSADLHLATALIRKVATSVPDRVTPEYKAAALKHQAAVEGLVFGAGKGTIAHSWHGSLADRRYVERWDILVKFAFKPSFVARRPSDGILEWTKEASPAFREAVVAYFTGRNEDSKVVNKADIGSRQPAQPVKGGGGGGNITFSSSSTHTTTTTTTYVHTNQPVVHPTNTGDHHHHHHHSQQPGAPDQPGQPGQDHDHDHDHDDHHHDHDHDHDHHDHDHGNHSDQGRPIEFGTLPGSSGFGDSTADSGRRDGDSGFNRDGDTSFNRDGDTGFNADSGFNRDMDGGYHDSSAAWGSS